MKARHLMYLVASATMLFAACGDDDNDKKAAEAEANTLVYAGKTYPLRSHYMIASEGRGYADAESLVQDGDATTLFNVRADVDAEGLNRTLDLTLAYDDASYSFSVNNGDGSFSVGQDMHYAAPYGYLNDQNYEESVFQSGTISVSRTDALFTYKVSGVLRNGESLSFHLSVPASEWEEASW